MKKFYLLTILGLLAVLNLYPQYSPNNSGLQKRSFSFAAPLKENNFSVQKNPLKETRIEGFDSLNLSYQGSWGFGQSFSVSSDASGHILFIGSGSGVIIMDVTVPSAPVKISELSTRGLVDAIYYDEPSQRLYVTAYFAGFEIWDVSDMTSPVRIGGGPTTGLPRGGIYADGNIVYVVTVIDGLQVFDVTNPLSPVNIATCILDYSNLAWNSCKSGNLIFVALGDGGLAVVDVANPASPYIAGNYYTQATGVWAANGYAFLADYTYGLHILNISNLSNITEQGSCTIPGWPYRVSVKGNYAYVANATTNPGGGLNVVDVSSPSNPGLLGTYSEFAEHVTANGNMLAITGGTYPCVVYDITDPSTPSSPFSILLPTSVIDLEVNGNYGYTGSNGFRVFDLSDKTHPLQIGYEQHDGATVRLAGTKAVYIRESMTSNNPVMVMDVTDPANPAFLGQYMSPVMTNDLEVRGDFAYVSCWWDGLRVVDIQDPANPVLASQVMGWFNGATPGVDFCYAQALDVDGNYLYIIDYGPFAPNEDTKGLYIFDISDPANPVLISRYTDFQSGGYDLDADGNFVYIADQFGGVEIIDVTDKQLPVTRGYAPLPDGANALKVAGNYVLVADYINGGVQMVNVTDPDNPSIDGYYAPTGCFALGVNSQDEDIYVSDGSGGFQIYSSPLITGTGKETMTQAASSHVYPNPFLHNVKIRLNNSIDGNDIIHVYDAAGNMITDLQSSKKSDKSVIYEWNGKTASGTEAGSGFYYYGNESGTITGKLVKR